MVQNVLCLIGCGLVAAIGPKVVSCIFLESRTIHARTVLLFAVGVLLIVQKALL